MYLLLLYPYDTRTIPVSYRNVILHLNPNCNVIHRKFETILPQTYKNIFRKFQKNQNIGLISKDRSRKILPQKVLKVLNGFKKML